LVNKLIRSKGTITKYRIKIEMKPAPKQDRKASRNFDDSNSSKGNLKIGLLLHRQHYVACFY